MPEGTTQLFAEGTKLCDHGKRLLLLNDSLAQRGVDLPGYVFITEWSGNPQLSFTRPAKPKLAEIFGADGWKRSRNGNFFDYRKHLSDFGVTIRISEAEEISPDFCDVPAQQMTRNENL